MLRRRAPASTHALTNQLMTAFTTGRSAGSLPGDGLELERDFVFNEINVLDGGRRQDEVLGNLAGDDDAPDRSFVGEVFLEPAHISKNLTYHSIIGAGNLRACAETIERPRSWLLRCG